MLGTKPKPPDPLHAAEADAKPQEKPRELPIFRRGDCKLEESVNNRWRILADNGITLEDLQNGAMYGVIAHELQAGDLIHVLRRDQAWWAELLVLYASAGVAQVHVLRHADLPAVVPVADGVPPGHEITYDGPEDLWVVRRLSDRVVLGKHFASHRDGLKFLLEHPTLRAAIGQSQWWKQPR